MSPGGLGRRTSWSREQNEAKVGPGLQVANTVGTPGQRRGHRVRISVFSAPRREVIPERNFIYLHFAYCDVGGSELVSEA